MSIPDERFGTTDRAADRLSHADLTGVCPVQETALQQPLRVTPEPTVVNVRVPVSKRDEVRIAVQNLSDPLFRGNQSGDIAAELLAQLRCAHVFRKQFRITPDKIKHPV